MAKDVPVNYRRALEALRSGVPNGDAVRVLGSNQSEVEAAFLDKLSSVDDLAAEGKQAPGLVIAGGFGAGKSHLLDYLQQAAIRQNFVCSRVVISKETPLFDPAKVYAAAIDSAAAEGVSGEVMREIVLRLNPASSSYASFAGWANDARSELSQQFSATVLLHEQLNNDSELINEITNFWLGERLAISQIRQGLKRINRTGTYQLKAARANELALQRFLFMSRLLRAGGFGGWVLLIDEVELVGRYSLLQRGRSYAELARWMGKVKGEVYPGLTAVAAITDDFALAVLQEKSDRTLVPAKLRDKNTDEYTALARRAETGMRLIEREAMTLRPPNEEALRQAHDRLREMHAKAYGWKAPELVVAGGPTTRRMRSYVRRWINEWDLRRIYPGAMIATEDEQEMHPSYTQDEDLEVGSASGFEEA